MAITAKEAIEAVKDSKGFVTTIAKRLGCSRSNVYALMNKFESVNQAVIDEREQLKDFAESKLFQQMDKDNIAAIIFYLKTQAKDRGYIERQDINVQVENELNKAMDLLEKRLSPKEYEHVIDVLANSENSTPTIKLLPS